MTTPPDHIIMSAVKAGELDQMKLLYHRHRNALMGFFFRLTGGDRIQSEDLVQNVFLRALKYRNSYKEGAAIKPWLFQLARNVFYDHFSRRKLYRESLDIDEWKGANAWGAPAAETKAMEEQDEKRFLKQALEQMKPESRELIELCKYQELPYKEVATMLNMTEGNVKVKLHRAIKKLGTVYHKLTYEAYES